MQPHATKTNHTATARPLGDAARLLLSCLMAALLALCASPRALAWAETTDIDAEADEAQQEVERTAREYDEATAQVEELEGQIADNQERIAELEEQLPGQRERCGEACRTLYQLQRNSVGLIDMLLGIQNLNDFISTLEYLTHIQQSSLDDIEQLQDSLEELEEAQADLEEAQRQAAEQQQAAADALAAAQLAREQAQQRAQEQAEAEAEEEASEEAEEEDEAEEAASGEDEEEAEEEASEEAEEEDEDEEIEAASSDEADWSSDKETFVAQWASRIDAYLAGSAMAGLGECFAQAAWDYGVDPRWSPAIAYTESSLGAHCAHSYNAWGWGSVSWGSWEEAIDAHVAGLARGYGYTISVTAAKKYCPSNWKHWYNVTSAQMECI